MLMWRNKNKLKIEIANIANLIKTEQINNIYFADLYSNVAKIYIVQKALSINKLGPKHTTLFSALINYCCHFDWYNLLNCKLCT
jgi:hypothetical protein